MTMNKEKRQEKMYLLLKEVEVEGGKLRAEMQVPLDIFLITLKWSQLDSLHLTCFIPYLWLCTK